MRLFNRGLEKNPYSKEELQAMLPEVGDRLTRVPTYVKMGWEQQQSATPQPCVVEYVNTEHLWYTVRFETGRTESYKVPEVKDLNRGGWKNQ